MKVSGSHIERVSAWTNRGYESAEKFTIQNTVEKLAKEGKHVINIIHGDKTMIGGDYAKTITFLWESDNTDPVYVSALKNAEKKRKEEQAIIEKRNLEKKATQAEFVRKGLNPTIKIVFGILLGILGIAMICCFLMLYFELEENILFIILSILGGIICLISFILFLKGCVEIVLNYLK